MRDPHVERLIYRLKADDSVSFGSPPPIEQETDEFGMRLEDGVVTFEMKSHHASGATARRELEQWLRAWEIGFALDTGRPALGFEFAGAEVVDRNPPGPDEVGEINVSDCVHAHFCDEVRVQHVMPTYPSPPSRFRTSDEVETMWLRFRQHQEGR